MTSLPPVIGIYAPAPQSGKTTVANYLAEHGYVCVSLAEPIKAMTEVFLHQFGFDAEEATHAVQYAKGTLVPELGLTVRQLLQTLGTEWGRTCLHPDVWVMTWSQRVHALLATGHRVVCDDVRRCNEASAIRIHGGQLWRVTRPSITRTTNHISEGELDTYPDFDVHCVNDGTLAELHRRISEHLGATTPNLDATLN